MNKSKKILFLFIYNRNNLLQKKKDSEQKIN